MISSNVVLTAEHLNLVVRYFMRQPGLSFDVESVGIHRGIPALNTVTWLSMSTFGMTVAIPCGHPIGSRVIGTAKEPRKDKNGKIRQFSVPIYEDPPPQLTPEQVFDTLRPLFFREDILKIAHEATFDLGSTAKYWGEICPGPYGDTKVLMRLLDENKASQNNGLKAWVKRNYGVDYDKEDVGKRVEIHPFNKVAHYSYMDALYTWLIWQQNIGRVRKEKLEVVHDEVERPLIGPLTSMRLAGINMDVPRLESTRDELSARLVTQEAAVYRAAGQKFNLSSPPQKQEILFGAAEEGGQGLKPWKKTDKGGWSTDADTLKSYPENKLCRALLDYAATHTLLSTYVNSWLGVDGDAKKEIKIIDGLLYTEFQQHGTVTGRFSGRSPSLQNCVDAETEVLTPSGWVRFPDLQEGNKVAQFHEDGTIEFVIPGKIHRVPFKGLLVTSSAAWGEFRYTDEHRVVSKTRGGRLVLESAAEWLYRWPGQTLIDRKIIRAGVTTSTHRLSPEERKQFAIAIAVQAEGSKCADWNEYYALVFKSERKIRQAQILFGREGKRRPSGRVAFYIHQDEFGSFLDHSKEKNFVASEILGLCTDDLEFFLSQVRIWDGSFSRKEETYGQKPTRSVSVDVVQAACTLTGRSTSRYVRDHFDVVNIHPSSERYASHTTLCREPYTGTVYCVSVPTGMFVIRRGGTPLITGNCPRPDKPDGKLIRGAFIAPPGHKLVVADYGQIELVILAHLIGRGRLFDGFLAGVDPHTMHAAGVLGRKPLLDQPGGVTKAERQLLGKTLSFCVPMDSEALTRTGWKHYDDLTTHDEVLGYENGVLRWTPVEAKYKFADQPVVEMSTGGWKSRSTPHHRWVCDRRTGRGTTRRYVDEFRTTENINTECRIKLSALVDAEGEPSISVRDASIIGWVVTDGCVQRADDTGRTSQGVGSWKRSLSVSIYQSATANPDKVKIIDALLVDVPHSRYENPSRAGSIQWLLRPQFARDLWSRTGMDTQDSLSDFVLKLTTQARGAFLEACWLGDGGVDPYGVKLLYQNEGEVLDAMQLAAYMEGYDVPRYLAASKGSLRQFPDGSSRISTADHYSLRLRKPLVTGQQMKRVDVGTADVWCVQTPLKSWVMRQNNRIMLTGNTIVNGAGPKTIAETAGVSEKRAKEIQRDYNKGFPEVDEYRNAMIRMAKSRSGTPYVRSLLGRKRRLPGLYSSDNGLRMYNERQLFNFLIQGGAADLMKLALIRADYMLADQVPDAFLTMTVHDELVAVAPDESAEECRSIIVEAMTGPEMQKLIKVPLKVDAHVVERWNEAK